MINEQLTKNQIDTIRNELFGGIINTLHERNIKFDSDQIQFLNSLLQNNIEVFLKRCTIVNPPELHPGQEWIAKLDNSKVIKIIAIHDLLAGGTIEFSCKDYMDSMLRTTLFKNFYLKTM